MAKEGRAKLVDLNDRLISEPRDEFNLPLGQLVVAPVVDADDELAELWIIRASRHFAVGVPTNETNAISEGHEAIECLSR